MLEVFPLNNFAFWMLCGFSLIVIFYTIERLLYMHTNRVTPQQFMNGIISLVRNRRYNEALTVCEGSPGVVPLLVKTAIVFKEDSREGLIHRLSTIASLEIPLLERRLNSIRLIAKIAPSVSCVGVIQNLAKILLAVKATETYFSANVVLSFLQNAMFLVTFGLTINIIAVLVYALLHGRVLRLIHDMEWSSNEIINLIDSNR